ncbi:hypothetical protein VQ056_21340 [Paenibacillus sp. JTLBN-2024]|nr:hypothetical protein CM49_02466 [Paenibacillus sp. P1XP2]
MQPSHRQASSQARTSSTPAGKQGRGPVAGNQKQAPQAGRPIPATKKKKPPKDRLGQAVVSLIFGIFGILMFIMSLFAMDLGSGYEAPAGAMFMMLLSFIVSLIGFVLGIRARRSPSGRGMAIAGITLTAIPVALMTITIILVFAIMYVGSQATIG